MDKIEYLKNVSAQIRNKRARKLVETELMAHIEDQTEAFQTKGFDKAEAEVKAVCQMGDPVSVGMEMDRIHRPKFPAAMVSLMGFFSLISIMVQYIFTRDLGEELSEMMFQKHVCFVLLGFAVMLLVCIADYTILGKYGKVLAIGFLVLLGPMTWVFGSAVNGARRWLTIGSFSISLSAVSFLYLPVFGGVLYAYRGKGYAFLWRILIWMLLPVLLVLRMPAMSSAVILFLTEFAMLITAIHRGWFKVNAKKTSLGLCGGLGAGILFVILHYITDSGYQGDRVRAWMGGVTEQNYLIHLSREIMQKCHFFGESTDAVSLTRGLPGVNMDFALVGMMAKFGTATVCIVLFLFVIFLAFMIRTAIGQKNQLGMIVGLVSSLGIGLELLLNLGVILTLFPTTGVSVPLLSYSGSSTVITYALIGFVLSIYRNQELTRDPKPRRSEMRIGLQAK